MKISDLKQRMEVDWASHLQQPSEENILSTTQLNCVALSLADKTERIKALDIPIQLCDREKITRNDAYRSVNQLLKDLGESITRCEDRQAFLSTSLFLFLAADTVMRFQQPRDSGIEQIGKRLLNHYVSTGILVEKEIELEQRQSQNVAVMDELGENIRNNSFY